MSLSVAYEKILGELLPSEIAQKVSRRERREKNKIENKSLTYGEIGFEAMSAILKKLPPQEDLQVMVDLGSGVGKAVFAAALLYPFKQIVGIEYLEGLHQLSEHTREGARLESVNQFLLGDFLVVDAGVEPDIVFIHCACFSEKFMKKLVRRLTQTLKQDAIVVTVSIQLPQRAGFHLLDTVVHSIGDDNHVEAIIFLQRYSTPCSGCFEE